MSRGQKDTREHILETTWRLLESHRGQSVRLEDIAHEAGVSRQAVYLHFGSRTELFIATARYVDEVLRLPERIERIQQACSTGGGVAGMREMVAFWGNYIPEIYGLAKALISMQETDEAAAAAWADQMEAFYQGCLLTLEQVAREGLLAPTWTLETAAEFFWAMLSIEIWERLTIERGWSNDQYIERMQWAAERAFLNGTPGKNA
jgi:AcrR family transcriptional regulator